LNFLDEATLLARGGRGGNGCVAFRREKFVPRGGPAGGDGGKGGSVILVGEEGLNTLYHLRARSIYAAERGRHGEGSKKSGRSGEDLEIRVPLGTQVSTLQGEELSGEILAEGERLVVARGGRGGRGNARFVSSTRQAPDFAEPGEPGEERELRLELKLIADVGIIGLPNAGKSTFIRVVSAARPKVADYPFTTLVPTLGVVVRDVDRRPFVVADLPGLIRGAAEGAGLGHRFLRHVERCRVLLHFVDLSFGEQAAADELGAIERELSAFDPELSQRLRLVVGSKLDAADEERKVSLASAARKRGLRYFEISSLNRKGVDELIAALEKCLETPCHRE
jgi:GTP-binding protein